MFNALLAWLKDEKVFLKVQSGTGDNLLEEDIREGVTDYCYGPRSGRKASTPMANSTWNAWTAAWSCSGKTAPP